VTPFRVAFVSPGDDDPKHDFQIRDDINWTVVIYAIDFAFLIDVFINFASAY